MAAYCASKAGVEAFGNALRLEVAHKGVRVGTVHPSWIDTDLVRDQKAESPTFQRDARRAAVADGRDASGGATAPTAIVAGIERRRRKVYVPRAVAIVQAMRALIVSPVGEFAIQRRARTEVPQLEAEVQQLGRYWGASSAGLGAPREKAAVED